MTERPARLILLSHHDMDGGFGRRVLDRVSQHVLEALAQPLGVREHDHFVRGLHLDLMRRSAEGACHLLRNAREVHRPEVDPEQPLVDPGDVEEIADHALDSIEASESGLGVLAVARRVCPVPAADQLESHGDRRDQAAKVVGKDRHQFLGNGAPALLDGGAREFLNQLGAMNHHAYHRTIVSAKRASSSVKNSGWRDAIIIMPHRRSATVMGTPIFDLIFRTVFTPRSSSGSWSRWPVRKVLPSLNTQTTRPPFDRGKTSRPLRFCSAESGWVLLPIATSVSFSGRYRKASTLSASKALATSLHTSISAVSRSAAGIASKPSS